MKNPISNSSLVKNSPFAFTTKRPVAITMVTLTFFVFGLLSLQRLPLNLMPDMSYPSITVRTEYQGAAPEEVENSISKPIEQLLGVVENLQAISSISKAGQSDIILEFSWDTDIDNSILDIREQLDRFFFQDAEKPIILRYDPTLDPIMRFSVYQKNIADTKIYLNNEDFLRKSRRYADEQLKRKLEIITGVAAVKIKGGLEEEIRVRLSEKQLNLLNLNIRQITNRLQSENVNVAGGNIREGQTEYIVRTLNEFRSIDEIADIVIAYKNNSAPIYLKDVAEISRSHKDRDIITRSNNRESVEIEIFKEADANIVEVAKRVRIAIFGDDLNSAKVDTSQVKKQTENKTNLANQLHQQNLDISLLSDQSVFIKNSIDEVQMTAISGGFLAILVLFIFLRDLKSTIIIGAVIPISIFFTFWPMDLFSVSLNMMSLGGLALGIGMLVDSAIVVLESIYRCREEGDDFISSVVRGTSEVGGAVIASTLTTVAVFFPIVFVEGVAGQIFGDLALTVVFSLLASLIAAMFLIPMFSSRKLDYTILNQFNDEFWLGIFSFKQKEDLKILIEKLKTYSKFNENKFKLILMILVLVPYIPIKFIITFIFDVIGKVILIFLFLLVKLFQSFKFILDQTVMKLLMFFANHFNAFYSRAEQWYIPFLESVLRKRKTLLISVLIPVLISFVVMLPRLGSELIPEVHQGEFNIDLTYKIGTPVEETSKRTAEIETAISNLEYVDELSSRSGVDKTATTKSEEGSHTAKITVKLKKNRNMIETEDVTINQVRDICAGISGLEVKITRSELFSFKTPIEVYIKGFELDKLKSYNEIVMNQIDKIPGIVDLKSNMRVGNPEIHIVYDREKIAKYGLNLFEVASLVRNKVLGDISTKYRDKDRRIDITVLLQEADKASIASIGRLIINPGQKTAIMLGSIASITIAEGPSEIRRVGQERTAVISANVSGERDLKSIIEDIKMLMAEIPFEIDFFYEVAGQNKEMETSTQSLIAALLLAVFLVYIIMASQFESFIHPFVIMFSIPLALVGVIITLYILNIPLSVMVFLGLIMLAGIVVNNAIVLISQINLLREKGLEKFDAIVQGSYQRLRPIFMTTATTVLGLLPMAIGGGDGSEIRQPMAITVIAGLTSSTFLTLVIIPILYAMLDRTEIKELTNENKLIESSEAL